MERGGALEDLRNDLKEEWFEEVGDFIVVADTIASSYYKGFYNFELTLYVDFDGNYVMLRTHREPIGDYGRRTVEQWFKCIDNGKVDEALGLTREEAIRYGKDMERRNCYNEK